VSLLREILANTCYQKQSYEHITVTSSLKYSYEDCEFKERCTERLQATQKRLLRPLLAITRRDHQRNSDTTGKLNASNIIGGTENCL